MAVNKGSGAHFTASAIRKGLTASRHSGSRWERYLLAQNLFLGQCSTTLLTSTSLLFHRVEMRQLWIIIISIYLCGWVSSQGSDLSVEKRPDNGQMLVQNRPNRNKRPQKQSTPAQSKQPAQQIPPQRDPKPVTWDGRRVDYVGQCTNAYLKELQMANHHPSAPVFCADCIRFNGRIKRNSCMDLNYCLGYDKTQGVLIRQWEYVIYIPHRRV